MTVHGKGENPSLGGVQSDGCLRACIIASKRVEDWGMAESGG